MSRIPRVVTGWIIRRPVLLGVLAGLLFLACVVLSVWRLRLDTEVLNLLPGRFSTVSGLLAYNQDFSQARELTFVLSHSDPMRLELAQEEFAEALQSQPWVQRTFYRPPLETEEGLLTFSGLAAPLLYHLSPQSFAAALEGLEPESLTPRLMRMRELLASGSPKVEAQLNFDPFGLATRALEPLQGDAPIERGQPLMAPDGKTRLVLAVTAAEDLDAQTCREIMAQVRDFIAQQRELWGEGAPRVGVTGRTAFVAEISSSMQRDIMITLLSSAVLITFLFFMAFGRLSPLAGIGTVLLLACAVALATGGVIFGALNVLTVGFCAILLGLGVDFGVLLYARYQQSLAEGESREGAIEHCLRELGPSILYGSGTTGLAFLTLIFSESVGFTQLGTLIAIGVVVCAFLMMGLLFVFIRRPAAPRWHDPLYRGSLRLLGQWQRRPRLPATIGIVIFGLFLIIAISPNPPIPFDADPRSLEPTVSDAGEALRVIEEGMGRSGEPFILMVAAPDRETFHERWQALHTHLKALKASGEIKGFYSPAPMVGSPERFAANAEIAREFFQAHPDWRETIATSVKAAGFNPAGFANSLRLVETVEDLAEEPSPPEWQAMLPQDSSWLFLVERYFSSDPTLAVAFVTPNQPIATPEEAQGLRDKIEAAGVPVILTGWSFTLMDLIPWTERELIGLTSLVLAAIAVLLGLSYREFKCWWIHLAALILAFGGMMATLKLVNQPITLLNVLAFPLVLGVGVDYGLHTLMSMRASAGDMRHVAVVLKSVLLGGLTTIAGFGSLAWSNNPSLSGLGIVCAIGVLWCLLATLFFVLPTYLLTHPAIRSKPDDTHA